MLRKGPKSEANTRQSLLEKHNESIDNRTEPNANESRPIELD